MTLKTLREVGRATVSLSKLMMHMFVLLSLLRYSRWEERAPMGYYECCGVLRLFGMLGIFGVVEIIAWLLRVLRILEITTEEEGDGGVADIH